MGSAIVAAFFMLLWSGEAIKQGRYGPYVFLVGTMLAALGLYRMWPAFEISVARMREANPLASWRPTPSRVLGPLMVCALLILAFVAVDQLVFGASRNPVGFLKGLLGATVATYFCWPAYELQWREWRTRLGSSFHPH